MATSNTDGRVLGVQYHALKDVGVHLKRAVNKAGEVPSTDLPPAPDAPTAQARDAIGELLAVAGEAATAGIEAFAAFAAHLLAAGAVFERVDAVGG